ncbi:hypothetical protein J0H58_05270 [bacterium]|nr:hypothetical protein [bacterium]
MTSTLALTASDVLASARAFGPAVEGSDLVFVAALPAEVARGGSVLHSGLRAVLSGRAWFGCGSSPRAAAPRRLNPHAQIPHGVTLLAVAGDERWDRIDPAARAAMPELFATPAGVGGDEPDAPAALLFEPEE